jgi:predicted Zn-ribbon and HTH transcriptional regulator
MSPPSDSGKPRPPAARKQTVREHLRRALREGPATANELSAIVGVAEKQVLEHLEHLARSIERDEEQLVIAPSRCLACGFQFSDRTRLTKPSRCPECKSTRITLPRFRLE